MKYPDDTENNTGFWRKVTSLETIDEACQQTMHTYFVPWDSNSLEVNLNCVKVETCEEQ
jgi:hypothetical protein